MNGIVTKSTGSWYTVLLEDQEVSARLRGKIRTQGLKSTNPVTVGDRVDLEHEDGEYLIAAVHDRRNCIVRRSNKLSKQYQLIAANIDLAVLVITPGKPYTPMGFIDRFAATAEAYDIPLSLLVNKSDLTGRKVDAYRNELLYTYQKVGYPCRNVSFLDADQVQELRSAWQGKTILLSGNSGVGKSTLINALKPGLAQKIGEISESYHKGKHTTTFAQMFQYAPNSFIIDTPGIKDFGLVGMEKVHLSHYFKEMQPLYNQCRFNDCLHVEEPGCAVQEALESGDILPSRYLSYLNMLEEIQEQK